MHAGEALAVKFPSWWRRPHRHKPTGPVPVDLSRKRDSRIFFVRQRRDGTKAAL
jgi:hypothetical protein